MKQYPLILGIALANTAIAEESNQCIDSLVIDIEVRRGDNLGEYLTNPQAKQRIRDKIKEEFETEVGLPTSVSFGEKHDGAITVMYMPRSIFRREVLPTYESQAAFIYRNLSEEGKKKWDETEKKMAALSMAEQEIIKRELFDSWSKADEVIDGITERSRRVSYLLTPLITQDPVMRQLLRNDDLAVIFARNAIHEIGHVLRGGGHAKNEALPYGEVDVMFEGITIASLDRVLLERYSFSDADKEKIKAQMCTGEK